MRIAVFSDVHSSYEKMKTVFREIDGLGVDRYVCLGDIIGYGDRPEETVRLMIEKGVINIRGNHELAMFNKKYLSYFPYDIKQPLLDNMAALSEKSMEYLRKAPDYLQMADCHFVHGTPPDKLTTYLYDVSDYYLKSVFNNSREYVFFAGHTHILKLITYKTKIIYRRRIRKNRTIPIEDHVKYLVNVGSVGVSRDDFDAPKYIIYDSEQRKIHIRIAAT